MRWLGRLSSSDRAAWGGMCSDRRMKILGKASALTLAMLALWPAAASARHLAIDGGDASVILSGQLKRELGRAGIEVKPSKPAHPLEKTIVLPLKPEGGFETKHGFGYAFLRGGIRLRAGKRTVAMRKLVLNTAKHRLSATIDGHPLALAATAGVDAYTGGLGLVVQVGSLRLTPEAAALLAAKLGSPEVFRAGRPLGRLTLGAPLFLIPVTEGAIHFSFDAGFRQKLESLGVSVSPYGTATETSSTFNFDRIGGEINPAFEHGELLAGKEEGIRLVQAGSAREVVWSRIRIGFENGYGGEGSDVVTASWTSSFANPEGRPIGQIEFGDTPSFNGKSGFFAGPTTAATLSSYAVQPLNEAFVGGAPVFSAGEPLGGFSFDAGVEG